MNNPGIGSRTIEIKFKDGYIAGYDPYILEECGSYAVSIVPKLQYNKWYHKILHYLTFKQRFVEGYTYKICKV